MKEIIPINCLLMIAAWLGLATAGNAQNRFAIQDSPEWVLPITVDYAATLTKSDEAGASDLLLIDKQFHVEQEAVYQHFAVRILNEQGLQEQSDISVKYDPLFQSLNFHSITVYRNGAEINKLKAADFKIIQQETGAGEYIYDGRLSAVIHLKDIHVGDVLDYSYTVKGRNPINKGKFYQELYWQYTQKVSKISTRLLYDPKRKFFFKDNGETPKATVTILSSGLQEHRWEKEHVPALVYDSQVPTWYDPTPQTYISEMPDWGTVVELLKPYYSVEKALTDQQWLDLEKQLFLPTDQLDDKLTKLLHFVQNDIRYLGLENGISAYKPHPPAQVLAQKFGDCKDKALLLCALLQKVGVEASPALVNTYYRGQVAEQLPSPGAFNHCIVNMQYKDSTYWFDATSSSQGGTYKTVSLLHYKKALLIKEGENQLQTIIDYPYDKREIREYFHVKKGSSAATNLSISSKYSGYEAESQRSYFKNNNIREIEKGYLNYFASLYPAISLKKELKQRDRVNSFETEETYEILDFWENSEQEGYRYATFYPLYLNDYLLIPKKKIREMPYQLNYPLHITEEMVIEMPEDWPVQAEKKRLSNEFFTLDYEVIYNASIITLLYDFKYHKDHVPADKIAAFTKEMNKAKDMLGYEVSYSENALASDKLNLPMIFMALLMLGIFIAKKKQLF